jgi:Mn2+/Fe2+ NRAMP family transporter
VLQGTLVPEVRFESTFLATLVAVLGTTISPYLFFWQTSEEVEEEMMHGRRQLTLHVAGKSDIDTAADAAAALRPLAGDASYILMALGLIGSGLLAVPILTTSGAYAVCEAFGWKWGLDKKLSGATQFYIVIGGSTLMGLLINFVGINPMDALLLAAVINGFLASPLLLIIMMIANNKAIMSERVNGPVLNVLGWVTTGVMFVAAIGLLLTWGNS